MSKKPLRHLEAKRLVRNVTVGGPWSPWPRDAWDGTCIWPSAHKKPPEWWDELWKITERLGGMVPRKGSFLEGYTRQQPAMLRSPLAKEGGR